MVGEPIIGVEDDGPMEDSLLIHRFTRPRRNKPAGLCHAFIER